MESDNADLPSDNSDFPEDPNNVELIPDWYQKMLQNKIEAAKNRLEKLSKHVYAACDSTAGHIRKIEKDNLSFFCKMDYYPHHPPMNTLWVDCWTLYGSLDCQKIKMGHAHTVDCLVMKGRHTNIVVPMTISEISKHDYSQDVIDSVELLKDFILEIFQGDIIKAYSIWKKMNLFIRSNRINDFIIVICVPNPCIIPHLKKFFESGRGRNFKAKSVFCFDDTWPIERKPEGAILISGSEEMQDTVGSLSILYDSRNCLYPFNSVEAVHLDKIIQDYMGLTKETTLLDVGCNFGVLSLLMANKCEQVIGLGFVYTKNMQLATAERLKKANNIHNVTFIACDPTDILINCLPLIKQRKTMAVINLRSPYSKNNKGRHVIRSMRNMSSVSKILIYGAFGTEFYRTITLLTCKNNELGEPFLPMEGCILDKSPSILHHFNIIILFERKLVSSSKMELQSSSHAPESFVNYPFYLPPMMASNQIPLDCPPPPPPPPSMNMFQFNYPTFSYLPASFNQGYQYNFPVSFNQGFQYNFPVPSFPIFPGPYNFLQPSVPVNPPLPLETYPNPAPPPPPPEESVTLPEDNHALPTSKSCHGQYNFNDNEKTVLNTVDKSADSLKTVVDNRRISNDIADNSSFTSLQPVTEFLVQANVSIFSLTDSESPKVDVEIERELRKKPRLA